MVLGSMSMYVPYRYMEHVPIMLPATLEVSPFDSEL